MARKKSTRLMILLAIMGALVLLIAQLSGAFAIDTPIFVSTDSSGTVDGVDFTRDDILVFDGGWDMYFDGEDFGLDPSKHDIEAFAIPGDPFTATTAIYMSFYQNKVLVDDIGQVRGQDIVKVTDILGPLFELYFDGSDVGLTTVNEKIDGLDIIFGGEEPFGLDCAAYIFISTYGEYSIPAANSGVGVRLRGDGSDVLLFCATNTGEDTAGFWYPFFDGQEEGMPKNFTDSLTNVEDHGDHIFFEFLTPAAFDLEDAFGGHSEVYDFHPNGPPDEDFGGPDFSAPDEGLEAFVDGLEGENSD